MIFRLSHKLNTKIKAGKLSEVPLDENPYADWSCHVFTAARNQYIIMANTRALYSVVMFGKGITNDSKFIERAMSTLREFMAADGQASVYQRFMVPASGTVRFAKTLNRSVTGSMNELVMAAHMYLVEDDMAPHEVGFKLNGILLSTLKNAEGRKYAEPRGAFTRLMDDQSSSSPP